MKRSIPILLYHHISPDREITPSGFERQLRWLLDQGYRSLSVSELMDVVRGRPGHSDQPGFVVTFDDGYLDNWVYAYPILRKLTVKAAVYLVTERVENHPSPRVNLELKDTRSGERNPGGFLSWAEAREMAASGLVEFGSHTQTHRGFVRSRTYENLEQELILSKQMIEAELKRPCLHLAWPWGDYETTWWPLLEKAGYETAMTTLSGANTTGSNPLALKRFKVSQENLDWLASRIRWNSRALAAQSYALMYGWDRRFKTWIQSESPYSHG
jgi:peptidoglycan/xylan/chitin deacetylase (PgdA/CDA1 family)